MSKSESEDQNDGKLSQSKVMELWNRFTSSATALRVAPFILFVALTSLQGRLGETSPYWIYLFKTVVGAGMVWAVWPWIREMRWAFSWEAVAVGVGVFVVWVFLDPFYPKLTTTDPASFWNPHQAFGDGAALAWMFVVVRIVGSSLVVPPLEEVFYRSFMYRYIIDPDFEKISLGTLRWMPFWVTSIIFGVAHPHFWFAGIICGLAYQWLMMRKKRLGDSMTAHAITNFLLGIWVAWQGDWKFW